MRRELEPEQNNVRLRVRADGDDRIVEIPRTKLIRIAMSRQLSEMARYLITEHHRTERGEPVDLDKNPQFRQIYADPSPDMRIVAPAQVGKSLYAQVRMFAGASLGLQMGMVFPKEDTRNQFIGDKVDRCIDATPYYKKMIKASGGKDSTKIKHFGRNGGSMIFVGCNSPTELMSFTADAMQVDERDECNRDNLPLYPGRMNYSPYRLTYECSTPTLPGDIVNRSQSSDNIHSEFLAGDQHTYNIRCLACGHLQCLDFYDHIVETNIDKDTGRIVDFRIRDDDYEAGSSADARPICTACGMPMQRGVEGVWVPHRRSAVRSYHINRLNSVIGMSLAELVEEFGKALGNPTKLQRFHNMHLGVPFAGGHMKFSDKLFQKCSGAPDEYRMQNRSEGPCTCGIDVNIPFFDVHVSEWRSGAEVAQRKVFAAKIQGVDELMAVLRRFNVKHGMIDNAPELRTAMKIQEVARGFRCSIVRAKYATRPQSQPLVVSESGDLKSDPPRLVTLDRTATIDHLFETMLMAKVRWFADWRGALDGKLLQEFKKPVRTVQRTEGGAERFVWVGDPDHQLHAANLDLQTGLFFRRSLNVDLSTIHVVRHPVEHQQSQPQQQKPSVDKPSSRADIGILRG